MFLNHLVHGNIKVAAAETNVVDETPKNQLFPFKWDVWAPLRGKWDRFFLNLDRKNSALANRGIYMIGFK